MNECEKIQDLLEAYHLGFLDEAAACACRAHLADCPSCREVLREVERTVTLLEKLPEAEASASSLEGKILASVSARGTSHDSRWLWPVAAVCLVGLGLGAWALAAAVSRAGALESSLTDMTARAKRQEGRLAGLEAAFEERKRSQESVGSEMKGRLDSAERALVALRSESARLREESTRIRDELARLDPVRARSEDLSQKIAALEAEKASLDRTMGQFSDKVRAQSAAIDKLADRQASSERAVADLAGRGRQASGAPGVPRPAPDTRVLAARTPESGAAGKAAVRPRTPWDAAYRMASGAVKGQGDSLADRIEEYENDLFRIYGNND